MKTTIKLILLLLACPLVLQAQDDMASEEPDHPRFLMFNQAMINPDDVASANANFDSLMKPVLDELADEGKIATWGALTHGWGDEWNNAWFMYAKDHETWLAAWQEMVQRVDSAAWPLLMDPVVKHKDNLMVVRRLKARERAEGDAEPRFVMLNQHVVRMADLPAANKWLDDTAANVLDAMVDEGLIHYWGQANHSWGDEWNFNFYFSSDSHEDFTQDWAEFVSRMQDQYPDAWADWSKLSQAHKDNLYTIRHRR